MRRLNSTQSSMPLVLNFFDVVFDVVDFEAGGFDAFFFSKPLGVAAPNPTANVGGVKSGMAFFGELFADFGVRDVVGKRLVDEGADFEGEFGDFTAVRAMGAFWSNGVDVVERGRLGGLRYGRFSNLRYGECGASFNCAFGA